jgi:hypothetical protein
MARRTTITGNAAIARYSQSTETLLLVGADDQYGENCTAYHQKSDEEPIHIGQPSSLA